MDILIGKHGNQPFPLSESSISRQHAILHVDNSTGKITLRDNNSTNGTWIKLKDGSFRRINGQAEVKPENTIRLGASFTCTVKQLIKKPEEPAVKIGHLRFFYDTYIENKTSYEAKSSNIMMLRIVWVSVVGVLGTIIFTAIPKGFFGDEETTIVIKSVASLILLVIGLLVISLINRKLIRQKKDNESKFKKNYCCPKCGYHFGPKVYSNLLAEGKCPNNACKCKYTEK